MSSENFIVKNVICSRNNKILFSPINFSLYPQEIIQIKGQNGVGKTTLLRSLTGLSKPLIGDVLWSGESIFTSQTYAEKIFYLGHKTAIKSSLTSLENLQFGPSHSEKPCKDLVETALFRVGLGKHLSKLAGSLSAGQKQRLALARLLFQTASLWILDEPFSSLDAEGIQLSSLLLKEHLEKRGMIIITSHQPLKIKCNLYKEVEIIPQANEDFA